MPHQLPRSVLPSVSSYQSGVLGFAPPPSGAFRSGSLGTPPPAPAFRSGSLGGGPPPSGAFKSGVLGVFGTPPPSGAFKSGSLGVLGTPPPSGAVKSGILGSLGVPPPSGAFRSGSLGVFGDSYAGVGAAGSIMPRYRPIGDATAVKLAAMYGFGDTTVPAIPKLIVAAAGLGAVAVIWWAMTRRHATT